ncbi:MAG: DUF4340 domain-containing protein, partial [Planctomycetota bacterium]
MKPKSLAIMAGTALVLSALALTLDSRRNTRAFWTKADEPLFPGLESRVNDVHSLVIESASDTTTLVRDGDAWKVAERGGYAGRSEDVGRILVALAGARRLEPLTSDPERYESLGLDGSLPAGFEDDASQTVRIALLDADGKTLAEIFVGRRRTHGGAESWYVREPDEAVTWSVEGKLRTPQSTTQWLQTELLDISRDRIREVRLVHADGETIELVRQGDDGSAFDIRNLPQGREPKSDRSAASFLGSLANLRLTDVRPASEVEFPEPPETVTTWWTVGGLRVTAELFEEDDDLLCRFDFGYDVDKAPVPEMGPAPLDPDAADLPTVGDVPDPVTVPVDDADPTPTREEIEAESLELREKTAGWVFLLPSWKKSSLVTTMQDLLAELPEESPDDAEGTDDDPLTD